MRAFSRQMQGFSEVQPSFLIAREKICPRQNATSNRLIVFGDSLR
jgi:hypothetical protein